jgi:hypothetical protein
MAAAPSVVQQPPAVANGFAQQRSPPKHAQPKVVLLHGLLRTADCMRKLERREVLGDAYPVGQQQHGCD